MNPLSKFRIVCPKCNTQNSSLVLREKSSFHCHECKSTYSMENGFLELLPKGLNRRTISHAIMEWEPIINTYESRWYRKSVFATLLFGISFQDEYELISGIADLKGHERVLDLACGPGVYTRPLAKQLPNGLAIGMDLSLPMLSHASSKARQEQVHNVLFLHGQAENLHFPNNEFDYINCCGALHLFSNLPNALKEIYRVLKPSGKFTSTAYRNWIPGALADKLVEWHYRHMGCNYFRSKELQKKFQDSGLINIICHHDKRYWIIMSAAKPA